MSNTTQLSTQTQITMSSREIAELTDKEHFHVLRDIEHIFSELGIDDGGYIQIWIHPQNKQEYKEYVLPKKYVECLLTGYSIPLRMKVIERIHVLETQLLTQHSNTNPLMNIDAHVKWERTLRGVVKSAKAALKDIPNATSQDARRLYEKFLSPVSGEGTILPTPDNDTPLTEEQLDAMILGAYEPQKKVGVDYINILSRFIDSVAGKLLVVSSSYPLQYYKPTDKQFTLKMTDTSEVLARFETNTNSLYVPTKVFNGYLNDHKFSRRLTMQALIKAKLLQQGWECKNRYILGKGIAGLSPTRTTCYKFILPAKLASKLI